MKDLPMFIAIWLLALTGSLDHAVAETDNTSPTVWFGASDFAGFGTLIEIHETGDQISIAVFGTAPLHYEFPLVDQQMDGTFSGDSAFQVPFNLRGREYILEGQKNDGIITATINGSYPLKLFEGDSAADPFEKDLPGLYEGEGGQIFITPREFGGIRAVELESGENFTLLKTGPRIYYTWQGLERDTPENFQFRFPKNQHGNIVALVVTWGGKTETYYRRETIRQKQITFQGGAGRLTGTILYPDAVANAPGLVLVHGSGPIYRTALTQQAVMFAKAGFAVLIYVKRGTGHSEGRWQGASFEDLAIDALAALSTLEAEPFVDPARTGFQGHSQAGYILPIAATKSNLADFVIIVNGGSITPWEQSLYDKRNDLVREGFGETDREAALNLMRRVYAYVLDREGDYQALRDDYLDAQSNSWFETTDLPKLETLPSWENDSETLNDFRAELAFDPKAYQRQMTMPVLVLLGEDDKTVPSKIVIEGWRDTLAVAGNPLSKIILIPDVGHGMRHEGSGVFTPEYATTQKDWLNKVLDGGVKP